MFQTVITEYGYKKRSGLYRTFTILGITYGSLGFGPVAGAEIRVKLCESRVQ